MAKFVNILESFFGVVLMASGLWNHFLASDIGFFYCFHTKELKKNPNIDLRFCKHFGISLWSCFDKKNQKIDLKSFDGEFHK